MKRLLCFASFGFACLCSGLSLSGSAVSTSKRVSWSLPGELTKSVSLSDAGDGYSRIEVEGLDAAQGESGAPALPTKTVLFAVPDGYVVDVVSVEASWKSAYTGVTLYPVQEPTRGTDEPIFTPPSQTYYSMDVYPAATYTQLPTVTASGVDMVPVSVTPFRYLAKDKVLEVAESMTVTVSFKAASGLSARSASSAAKPRYAAKLREQVQGMVVNPADVTVSSGISARAAGGTQPDYIVISPSSLVTAWQGYVNARAAVHPELTFAVKNADEIYSEYANLYGTTTACRNDQEKIWSYIKDMGTKGTMYFVLGGPFLPNGATVYDGNGVLLTTANAIPGVYGNPCGDNTPTDYFYACLDIKAGVANPYPWDSDGNGVYCNGSETTSKIDMVADVVVARMSMTTFNYGTGAGVISSADLIAAYTQKLARGEALDYAGRFKNGIAGQSLNYNSYARGSNGSTIRRELEFYDDAYNMFDMRHNATFVDSEVQQRNRVRDCITMYRPVRDMAMMIDGSAWSKGYANAGAVRTAFFAGEFEFASPVSHGWALGTGGFDSGTMRKNTGLVKVINVSTPCQTGWMDYTTGNPKQSAPCLGESAVNNPVGGALVSYNNSRSGWFSNSMGLDGMSSTLTTYINESLFRDNKTTGLAWKEALSKRASSMGGLGNRTTDCLIEVVHFGDPLVTLTPIADMTWTGAAGNNVWDTSVANWRSSTNATANVAYEHANNTYIDASANQSITVNELISTLTMGVNQAAGNTLTLTGTGPLKVLNGLVVTNGNLTLNVPGGAGREGVTFVNQKGILTLGSLSTTNTYVGKLVNASEVRMTGANAILDVPASTAIGTDKISVTGTSATANANNIIRTRTQGTLVSFPTIPVNSATLKLETVNVGGNAVSTTPLFAVTNGVLEIGTNPQWSWERLTRPIILHNSTLSATGQFVGFGNTSSGGLDITATGTSAISGSSVIALMGETRVNVPATGDTLTLSADFTDAGSPAGSIRKVGAGKMILADDTTAAGKLIVEAGTVELTKIPLENVTNITVKAGAKLVLPHSTDRSYQVLVADGTEVVFEEGALIYDAQDTSTAISGAVSRSSLFFIVNGERTWQGTSNGSGTWDASASNLAWLNGTTSASFTDGNRVQFADLSGVASATVTVNGTLSASFAEFSNSTTAYTFNGATGNQLNFMTLSAMGPATFNLPVGIVSDLAVNSGVLQMAKVDTPLIDVKAGATFGATCITNSYSVGMIKAVRYVPKATVTANAGPATCELRLFRDGAMVPWTNVTVTESADGYSRNGSHAVSCLIDGTLNNANKWWPNSAGSAILAAGRCYATITFAEPIEMFDGYGVLTSDAAGGTYGRGPTAWDLQVSTDGTTFYTVDSRSGVVASNNYDWLGAANASASVPGFAIGIDMSTLPVVTVVQGATLLAEGAHFAKFDLQEGSIIKAVPDKKLSNVSAEQFLFSYTHGATKVDVSALTLSSEPIVILEGFGLTGLDLYRFDCITPTAELRVVDGNLCAIKGDGLATPYTRTLSGVTDWSTTTVGAWQANGVPFTKTWANSALDYTATAELTTATTPVTLTVNTPVQLGTVRFSGNAPLSITRANNNAAYTPVVDIYDFRSFGANASFDFALNDVEVIAGTNITEFAGGSGTLTFTDGGRIALTDVWTGAITSSTGANELIYRGTQTGLPVNKKNVTIETSMALGAFSWSGNVLTIGQGANVTAAAFNHTGANKTLTVSGGTLSVASFTGSGWWTYNKTEVLNGGSLICEGAFKSTDVCTSPASVLRVSGAGSLLKVGTLTHGNDWASSPRQSITIDNGATLSIGAGGIKRSKQTGVAAGYYFDMNRGTIAAHGDWTISDLGNYVNYATIRITRNSFATINPGSYTITYNRLIENAAGTSGDGALVIGGADSATGKVVLTTANTYTGGTTITNTTLEIANVNALGIQGAVTMQQGAVLDLKTYRPTNVLQANAKGTLKVTISDTDATENLIAVASGFVYPSADFTVQLVDASGIAVDATKVKKSAGYLTYTPGVPVVLPYVLNVSGNTTWSSGAWTDAAGTSVSPDWTQGEADIRIAATANATVTLDCSVDITNVEFRCAANMTLAAGTGGTLTGAGRLLKTGTAMLTLNTVNTHTGGVLVESGTLKLGARGALGSGNLTLGGGTTFVSGVDLNTTDFLANVCLADSVTTSNKATIYVMLTDEMIASGAAHKVVTLANPEDFNKITFTIVDSTGTPRTNASVSFDGSGVTVAQVMLAQTWTGAGSTDNWSDAANWMNNTAPTEYGVDVMNFAGITRLTSVNDLPSTFASVLNFLPSAGAFTLDGTHAIAVSVISNATATAQTFNFPIDNTPLALTTFGPLVFNGGVAAGTVNFKGAATLGGTTALGAVTVADGKALTVQSGATAQFASLSQSSQWGVTHTVNGSLTIANTVTLNSTMLSKIQFNVGAEGVLRLNGVSCGSYAMPAFLGGGRVNIGSGGLSAASAYYSDVTTYSRNMAFNNVTIGAYADWSGLSQTCVSGQSLAGTVTFDTENCDGTGVGHTITLSKPLTGAGNLVKTGAGTLVLNAANTYTGTTTINGGTLKLGATATLGTGTVTFANGTTFDLSQRTGTLAQELTIAANDTVNLELGSRTFATDASTTLISWTAQPAGSFEWAAKPEGMSLVKTANGLVLMQFSIPTEVGTFVTTGNWTTQLWNAPTSLPAQSWANMASTAVAMTNTTADATVTIDANTSIGSLAMVNTFPTTLACAPGVTFAAGTYDFSGATAKTTLNFATAGSAVTAGADTVLTQSGSGTLTIGSGKKATVDAGWAGSIANSGTLVRNDSVTTFAFPGGTATNVYANGGTGALPAPIGGTLVFANGTYAISSMGFSATASSIILNEGAALNFPATDTIKDGFGLGTATFTMNGGTLTAQRFTLSQGDAGRTSVVNQNAGDIVVTGRVSADNNTSSIMFGHWNGPTTYNMNSGTFTATNAWVLIGKTYNNQAWYIGPASSSAEATRPVATVKGVMFSNNATGSNIFQIRNGGTLKVGDLGINFNGKSVNAKIDGTLAAYDTFSSAMSFVTYLGATLDVDADKTMTLTGAISNASGATTPSVTKTGAGTLVLSGANTYTGGTTVEAGTLKATGANAAFGTSTVTLTGGTLDVTEYTGALPSISAAAGTTVKSVGTLIPTFTAIAGATFETTLTEEQLLVPTAVTVAKVPTGTEANSMIVIVRGPDGTQVSEMAVSVNGTFLQVSPVLPAWTLTFTPTAENQNLTWNTTATSFMKEGTTTAVAFRNADTVKFLTGATSTVMLNETLTPQGVEIGGGFTFSGTGSLITSSILKKDAGLSTVTPRVDAYTLAVTEGSLKMANVNACFAGVTNATFQADRFGSEQNLFAAGETSSTLAIASDATLVASGTYTAAVTLESGATLKLTNTPLVLASGSTLATTGTVTLDVDGITMPAVGAAVTFLQMDTTAAPEATAFVLPAEYPLYRVVKTETGYQIEHIALASPFSATVAANVAWTDLTWTDANGVAVPANFNWTMASVTNVTLNVTAAATVNASTAVTIGALTINATEPVTISGSLVATSVNDSASTAAVTLNFATGSAAVMAGVDTILTQTGSGTLTIAANKKATAPAWSENLISGAGTFVLSAATADAVITATTKNNNFTGTNIVTRGVWTFAGGTGSGSGNGTYPQSSTVIVQGASAKINITVKDATGWDNPKTLTLAQGATALFTRRDSFNGTINFINGSRILSGSDNTDDGRSLDFLNNLRWNVSGMTPSLIGGVAATADATTGDPIVNSGILCIRQNATIDVAAEAQLDIFSQWGFDADGGIGKTLTKTGAGRLAFYRDAPVQTGGTTVSAGTLALVNKGMVSLGEIAVAAQATLEVFTTNDYGKTLANAITGAGRLVKKGAGTLTLSGANTYTGTTAVEAGTLKATGTSALSATSSVTLSTGTTLDITEYTGTTMPTISAASESTVKSVGAVVPTFTAIAGVTLETTLTAEQCLSSAAVTVAYVPANTDVSNMTVIVRDATGATVEVEPFVIGTALQVSPVGPAQTLTFTPTATTPNLTWDMTSTSFLKEHTTRAMAFRALDSVKFLTGTASTITLNETLNPQDVEIGSGFTFSGTGSLIASTFAKKDAGLSTVASRVDVQTLAVTEGALTMANVNANTAGVTNATFQADLFGKEQIKYVRLTITDVATAGNQPAIAELRLFRGSERLAWPDGTKISDNNIAGGGDPTQNEVTIAADMTYPGTVGTSNEKQPGCLIDGYYGNVATVTGYAQPTGNKRTYNLNKWWPTTNTTGPWVVQIEFPEAIAAFDGANFCTADHAPRHPKSWTLETSLDGHTWKTVNTTTGATFNAYQWNGGDENAFAFTNAVEALPTLAIAPNATWVASGNYTAAVTLESGATLKLTDTPLVLAPGSTLAATGSVTLDISAMTTLPEEGTSVTFLQMDTTAAPEATTFVLPEAYSYYRAVKTATGYQLERVALVAPFTATATNSGTWAELAWTDVNGVRVPADYNWSAASTIPVTLNVTAAATINASTAVSVGALTINASAPVTISGSVTTTAINDSTSTAAVTLNFATGSVAVTAGANTILTQEGTGTLTIAANKKATAPSWSANLVSGAGTFALSAPTAETVVNATAKNNAFTGVNAVTRGTWTFASGSGSGSGNGTYPQTSSVLVSGADAKINIAVKDATGWDNAKTLTLADGGTARFTRRDSFKGTINFVNGGKLLLNGDATDDGRSLDLLNSMRWNVSGATPSMIGGIDATNDSTTGDPIVNSGKIALRIAPTVDVAEGAQLDIFAAWGGHNGGANSNLSFSTTKTGAGKLAFYRETTLMTGVVNVNGGTLALVNKGMVSSGAIAVAANATLEVATINGYEKTLANTVRGAGRLVKKGQGKLTLTGTNAYTGGTILEQGTLALANTSALGTGTLTLATGTTLDLSALTAPLATTTVLPADAIATIHVGTRTIAAGNVLISWTAATTPEGNFTLTGATGFTVTKSATGLIVAAGTAAPEIDPEAAGLKVTLSAGGSLDDAERNAVMDAAAKAGITAKTISVSKDTASKIMLLDVTPTFIEGEDGTKTIEDIDVKFAVTKMTLDPSTGIPTVSATITDGTGQKTISTTTAAQVVVYGKTTLTDDWQLIGEPDTETKSSFSTSNTTYKFFKFVVEPKKTTK